MLSYFCADITSLKFAHCSIDVSNILFFSKLQETNLGKWGFEDGGRNDGISQR